MQKPQSLDEIPDKKRFVWETQIKKKKHSIFNCMKWGLHAYYKKEHNKNANNNNNNNNNNNKGSRGMGEVAPLYGVDSALVLTNPGVQ